LAPQNPSNPLVLLGFRGIHPFEAPVAAFCRGNHFARRARLARRWRGGVGKGCARRGAFASRIRGQRVFGSALPCAKRLRAVGARTGRARRNGFARDEGDPMACHWRGQGGGGDQRPETRDSETCPPAKSRVSGLMSARWFPLRQQRAKRAARQWGKACGRARDPPGERGAGGLTVAQRLRSPRSGNAQDARCSSDHAQAGGRWMNHDHAFFRNGKSHSLRKRRSVPKKIISGRAKPAPLESLMPMRSIVHAKSAA